MTDFDGVAMKGEVLNSLTQATDEVDEDAQVKHSSFLYRDRWVNFKLEDNTLPQNNILIRRRKRNEK